MANITAELQAIMEAILGEEVRGSIHDAIKKINDVGEVVLTTGTAITSTNSSSEGFFTKSVYLNTNTKDLWVCTGVNTWQKVAELKGTKGDPGQNGNKWFRGTQVAAGSTTAIALAANVNDNYLNTEEGKIYHCTNGGTTSSWTYDMTLSGGGGGDEIDWDQIITSGTKIAEITINGTKTDVYAPQGGGQAEFIGTAAAWEAETNKAKYNGKIVNITDDYESNICETVAECEASTNDNDVAGASAIAEINSNLVNGNTFQDTDEVIIGYWKVNGVNKPIYRKVFTSVMSSTSQMISSSFNSTVIAPISLNGVFVNDEGTAYNPIPFVAMDGTQVEYLYANVNDYGLNAMTNATRWVGRTVQIILDYIKKSS